MLRATKLEKKIVQFTKDKILRKLFKHAYPKIKDILDKKEEKGIGEGWRRTTTPKVKKVLEDSIYKGCLENKEDDGFSSGIKKFMDIFLLIYDTDDAYAIMFHRFLENTKNLNLDPDKKYYSRGKTEAERETYREKHDLEEDFYLTK